MSMTSLDDWLTRLEQMQPDRIELGLARISRVAAAAGLDKPPFRIVTVGGTNGKGSTVSYLASLIGGEGLSVGVYTSPHFIDFNERIAIDGRRVSEAELCEAFDLIDSVRGDTDLTYFEFTTLAAMHCFYANSIDVAVLEVGLGGRLDAVNAWDSDVACVTSIGIDHIDWLGDDREQIGAEKAGIARAGCALVCGDPEPPASIAHTAETIGATVLQTGRDFRTRPHGDGWQYEDANGVFDLPLPRIAADWAIGNAAVAICATGQLLGRHVPIENMRRALHNVSIAGRMQMTDFRGVPVILDVAHNAAAAQLLAAHLNASAAGKTTAVFSCMQDKDIDAILEPMLTAIDHWCVAELDFPRAIKKPQLQQALAGANSVDIFATVTTAFEQAVAQSADNDRVVVFGSFHVVGPVLSRLGEGEAA
jgi:dihydrofolate synthase/folylpolyglutamate synthase